MRSSKYNPKVWGYTLLELLIVILILGLLTRIALPTIMAASTMTEVNTAIGDIKNIEQAIELYYMDNKSFPPSLAAIGMAGMRDPWGNPYEYLPFDVDTKTGIKRKDENLIPVNSGYDLYSIGKDGKSTTPFTAKPGRDDVVRANDGQFVGLAEEY